MKTKPKFRVIESPLVGAPYTVRTIVLADGREVHSQISAYGKGEVEERVRRFLAPADPTPLAAKWDFGRSPGRPKRGTPPREPDEEVIE